MRPNPKLDENMRKQGYVSVQEASDRTSIPTSTLYDMSNREELESIRVGKRRYIKIDSLLSWGGEAIEHMWNESMTT